MTSQSRQGLIFREVQYIRSTWIWALVLVCLAAAVVALVTSAAQSGSMGMGDIIAITAGILIPLAVTVLLCKARLETEVHADGIRYRFFPFHLTVQKIPLDRLKSFEATKYNPILEYGGWGIRYGFKGKAYNVSGNRGVRLKLKDGAGMMMGSRRPEDLARAIKDALGQS